MPFNNTMKRILVCDDEEVIREFIEMVIEEEVEAEFIHADSGKDAVEILSTQKDIDLIICDMNMPEGNGDMVHLYNRENMAAPFIILSGYGDNFGETLAGFSAENKCAAVSKPWDDSQLISTVKDLLAA